MGGGTATADTAAVADAATAAAVADATVADVFVVFDRSKAKKGLALMDGIAAADGER